MASNSTAPSGCPGNPCSQLPFGNPAAGVSSANNVCWGGSCPNSKPKVQAHGLAEVTRSMIGDLPRLHLPSPGPNLSIQDGKAVDLLYRAKNEDAYQLQFIMLTQRPAMAGLPTNKLLKMAVKVKRALETRLVQFQTPGANHLWKLTRGQAEALLNMAGFLLHLAVSTRTQDGDLIKRFNTWTELGVTALAAGSCGGWLFPMGEIITAVKLAVEMNWDGFSKERWIRFFESQGLTSCATLPLFNYWALDDEAGAAIAKEKVLEEAIALIQGMAGHSGPQSYPLPVEVWQTASFQLEVAVEAIEAKTTSLPVNPFAWAPLDSGLEDNLD